MASRQRSSRRLPFEKVTSNNHQGRAHPNNAFYNSRKWRNYSKKFRADNRLCVRCQRLILDIADAVTDHLIRINDGGSKMDVRNHGAMHKDCHSSKSAAESRGLKLPSQKNAEGDFIPILNETFYKLLRDE